VEWPDGSIIGAIQKNGKVFRPEGNTKIEEGDIVVIFTLSKDVSEVERLFQVNIDFFLIMLALRNQPLFVLLLGITSLKTYCRNR
jgi:NhaP-type Na+/H+ and K+/H+ antiporter